MFCHNSEVSLYSTNMRQEIIKHEKEQIVLHAGTHIHFIVYTGWVLREYCNGLCWCFGCRCYFFDSNGDGNVWFRYKYNMQMDGNSSFMYRHYPHIETVVVLNGLNGSATPHSVCKLYIQSKLSLYFCYSRNMCAANFMVGIIFGLGVLSSVPAVYYIDLGGRIGIYHDGFVERWALAFVYYCLYCVEWPTKGRHQIWFTSFGIIFLAIRYTDCLVSME